MTVSSYKDNFNTIYYYFTDLSTGLRYYHRDDGPAVEFISGTKFWFQNGEYHREDGPAIEHSDGYKEWHYEGKYVDCNSQEQFERLIKLKAFW